jgi:hypothetical protein
MKNFISKTSNRLLWIVVWVSLTLTAWVYAAGTNGLLWDLFNFISSWNENWITVSNLYRLDWKNIEDWSITSYELANASVTVPKLNINPLYIIWQKIWIWISNPSATLEVVWWDYGIKSSWITAWWYFKKDSSTEFAILAGWDIWVTWKWEVMWWYFQDLTTNNFAYLWFESYVLYGKGDIRVDWNIYTNKWKLVHQPPICTWAWYYLQWDWTNWICNNAVAVPLNCTAPNDGSTILNWDSRIYYTSSTVSYNESCISVFNVRTCENWVLSGSGEYTTCSAVCTGPDDSIIPVTSSKKYYSVASVPFWSSCDTVVQNRSCSNSWLSGTFTNPTCIVLPASSCTGPDDTIIANWSNKTYYSAISVPFGSTCSTISEVRTCTDWDLSGTNTFPVCTVSGVSCNWIADTSYSVWDSMCSTNMSMPSCSLSINGMYWWEGWDDWYGTKNWRSCLNNIVAPDEIDLYYLSTHKCTCSIAPVWVEWMSTWVHGIRWNRCNIWRNTVDGFEYYNKDLTSKITKIENCDSWWCDFYATLPMSNPVPTWASDFSWDTCLNWTCWYVDWWLKKCYVWEDY